MFDCPTDMYPTGHLPAWQIVFYFVIAFVNLLASTSAFFFIGSILSKKTVSTNTLNLYVAFLLIPDAVFNLVSGVYCFFQTAYCSSAGPWRPVYEFTVFFYFFCNFYLNVVVAQEIYSLLEKTSRCLRARPPPLKRGIAQIALIYVLAFLFGLWGVLDVPWSYFDGLGGFRSPDGGPFSEVDVFILIGCLILIPVVYIIVISIMIRMKSLLPKDKGQTKSISVFFGRIIVLFFACYLPGAAINIFCTTLDQQSALFFWMELLNQCLYFLQSFVTMYMISFKEDIWKVVCSNFRACTCRAPLPDKKSQVNHRNTRRTRITKTIDLAAEQSQVIIPQETSGDLVQDSVEIDCTDPVPKEPIDILHPSIENGDDEDEDNDEDDDDGAENSVWVGQDL